MALWAEERFINETEHSSFGESGLYETAYDKPGDLFRAMQREYGRCISKVYMDRVDGTTQAIGWVFESRDKYQDDDETYLRHVWVTVHNSAPRHSVEYDLAELPL